MVEFVQDEDEQEWEGDITGAGWAKQRRPQTFRTLFQIQTLILSQYYLLKREDNNGCLRCQPQLIDT